MKLQLTEERNEYGRTGNFLQGSFDTLYFSFEITAIPQLAFSAKGKFAGVRYAHVLTRITQTSLVLSCLESQLGSVLRVLKLWL